jgi:hypothetical protein
VLVPFSIFNSAFRNEATLKCNNFLVRLPDAYRCLDEFVNWGFVRMTRFFQRQQIDRPQVLFPGIGEMMKRQTMARLHTENSFNPVSDSSVSRRPLAFAMSVMPTKLLEDRLQLSLRYSLFRIEMDTGGLESFNRFAKLRQI